MPVLETTCKTKVAALSL